MSLNKHAYLIMADRNYHQLQELITMLDDSRNDIYLLIDGKSSLVGHKFNTDFSALNYLKPINIYWGSYSQVEAELNLFRASYNDGPYEYYHLISGQDLPLVNQDKIHYFFNKYKGYEFIQYQKESKREINDKLNSHLFLRHFDNGIHSDRSDGSFICKCLWSAYRKLEAYINMIINERKIPMNKVSTASNWISVDSNIVKLIIESSNWIYSKFHRGKVIDELFVPTLLNYYPSILHHISDNTRYTSTPAKPMSNLRYIEKKDSSSHPNILTINDYKKLIHASSIGYFFARKFDSSIDNVIIDKVFADVMKS